MKITDVKTYIVGNPWRNWLFTRVETDEGVYGIGEAAVRHCLSRVQFMAYGMDLGLPSPSQMQACH